MFKHILICTDGSPLANKAAKGGIALAKALHAKVTAYSAIENLLPVLQGIGAATQFCQLGAAPGQMAPQKDEQSGKRDDQHNRSAYDRIDLGDQSFAGMRVHNTPSCRHSAGNQLSG